MFAALFGNLCTATPDNKDSSDIAVVPEEYDTPHQNMTLKAGQPLPLSGELLDQPPGKHVPMAARESIESGQSLHSSYVAP